MSADSHDPIKKLPERLLLEGMQAAADEHSAAYLEQRGQATVRVAQAINETLAAIDQLAVDGDEQKRRLATLLKSRFERAVKGAAAEGRDALEGTPFSEGSRSLPGNLPG